MATILLIIALVLIASCLVNGLFLWLGCKLFKVTLVTYPRALWYSISMAILSNIIGVPLLVALRKTSLVGELALFAANLLISIGLLQFLLRVSWGKLIGTWGVWQLCTIVYAGVLVVVLKTAVMEAFVIPTGGMADAVLGYHKEISCPKCGATFALNASAEADRGRGAVVDQCVCPNCDVAIDFRREGIAAPILAGDRLLILKYPLAGSPNRFDVAVFTYPESPPGQPKFQYVKRLAGLPGETIAIQYGDLYVARSLEYGHLPQPQTAESRRQRSAMFENEDRAVELFREQVKNRFEKNNGVGFEMLRKGPDQILALRRLVNDNDFQPTDQQQPRWACHENPKEGCWQGDEATRARRYTIRAADSNCHWLSYRHLGRSSGKPELVRDVFGYNSGRMLLEPENWVGDLMLECEVTIDQPVGELILDLAKGVDRFQARWQLSSGVCSLQRYREEGTPEEELATQPTAMKQNGTYRLRFANVDERLTVWVNDGLPFGSGVTYRPPRERGPGEHDLLPARIGACGCAVSVVHLKLWRDVYYTTAINGSPTESDAGGPEWNHGSESWSDPSRWEPLRDLPVRILYVQPGHYFVLGDNSTQSSDSRTWGLVPHSLLQGRADLIYYPFSRIGPVH